jgi:hypothetical protein
MHAQSSAYSLGSALPVVVVIAVASIAALGIVAWLVRDVARRAIERTSPDKVDAVVRALGSLWEPLRGFVPWSGRADTADRLRRDGPAQHKALQNETSQARQQGSTDEAQ